MLISIFLLFGCPEPPEKTSSVTKTNLQVQEFNPIRVNHTAPFDGKPQNNPGRLTKRK